MTTYREFTRADIPQISRLGERMHEESIYCALDYSPVKALYWCYDVLNDDNRCGFVAEIDGEICAMFFGLVTEYLYGHDLVAKDSLMYVMPEYRGSMMFLRLVNAYFRWARGKKVKQIFLSQSTGINVHRTTELYKRLGLQQVGGIFYIEGINYG